MLCCRRSIGAKSRAFHNGKGRPPTIRNSTRQLSTYSTGTIRPTVRCIWRSSTRPPSQITFLAPSGVRLASNAVDGAIPAATTLDAPPPAPLEPNAWDSTFADLSLNASNIEPHIGYLQELGLNFGYGPSSMMQWAVEHLHVYSGMPWFGTLMAAAILVRLSLLKLYMNAAHESGRLAALKPALEPFQQGMQAARRAGDQQAMMEYVARIQQVYKQTGLRMSRMFIPIMIQAPLGFATFRLTKGMSDLPVPDLQNGGFLWVTDLTIPDPNYVLPVFLAGTIYLTLKRGGEMGTLDQNQKAIMTKLTPVLPVFVALITSFQPAATQLVFATTGILSFFQSVAITNAKFREMMGIHPLPPKPPPNAKAGPYKGNITRYTGDDKKEKGLFGTVTAQWDKAKDWMASGQSSTRISKQERFRAEAYEKQRRAEIEEEDWRKGKKR